MTDKKWIFLDRTIDSNDVLRLSNEFGMPPIIATILLNRSITKGKDVKAYLSKSIRNVHHPFELKDAKKAAKYIGEKIKKGEKIVIYGDYDVDGITSTAILYKFLKSQGANVDYYIPNRSDEGYGINILALQNIRKEGASLLITVDCGITAVGEVEFAKSIGLEVIITDHHTCKEEIPRAYAVINPKQPDCNYPFKNLAGVGVVFKLILAMALEFGYRAKDYFDKYIDIVAIGTVADVVPLIDENRIFVANGIKKLMNTSNEGLKALFFTSGIAEKPISTGMISFIIAPRINAAGRVGSAATAVELLTTESKERAMQIALGLEQENRERQLTEHGILNDALSIIESDPDSSKKKVFVLSKENWHEGVIGIVASRIVDRYYRPTILISLKDGRGKGSGRSIQGFNLFEALRACSDLLLKFGGHELAAGLGLKAEDIAKVDKQINAYADTVLSDEDLQPSIKIDTTISIHDLSLENAEKVAILEPFGMGNPQPVFALLNATIASIRSMSEGRHSKLTLSQGGRHVEMLGFGMGELCDRFMVGDKIDVAFCMNTNYYRGEKQLCLTIKDVRLSLK